jgi:hypothetical protein
MKDFLTIGEVYPKYESVWEVRNFYAALNIRVNENGN